MPDPAVRSNGFLSTFRPADIIQIGLLVIFGLAFGLRLEARVDANAVELDRHQARINLLEADAKALAEMNIRRDIMTGALLQKNDMLNNFYGGPIK